VKSPAPKKQNKRGKKPKEKGKLSFKETRELESLPLIIEALEEEKKPSWKPHSSELYASRDLGKINAANRSGAVEKSSMRPIFAGMSLKTWQPNSGALRSEIGASPDNIGEMLFYFFLDSSPG